MANRRTLTEQLGLVELFESRGFEHVTVEGGIEYTVRTYLPPSGRGFKSHSATVIGTHDEIAMFVGRIEESVAAAVRGE